MPSSDALLFQKNIAMEATSNAITVGLAMLVPGSCISPAALAASSRTTVYNGACSITGGARDGTGNISAATNVSIVLAANSKFPFAAVNIDRKTDSGIVNLTCLLPPGLELHEVKVTEYDVNNQLYRGVKAETRQGRPVLRGRAPDSNRPADCMAGFAAPSRFS